MKGKNRIKKRKGLDNKGFSLVELIISIAILVIIMVPLMSNFIRSMQINKKAEKYQVQSNLAASIMEGLKASTIQELIQKFNEPEDAFDLIPNEVDEIMRLEQISADEYRKRESDIYDEQATDFYAIHGVKAGSSAYDVFIRLDAATEEYKTDIDDLNNYPMPEIVNLNEKLNGLFFSDGSSVYMANEANPDESALNAIHEQGVAYANSSLSKSQEYLNYISDYNKWLDACNEANMKGEPLPMADKPVEPTLGDLGLNVYTDKELLKSHIQKKMIITVNDNMVSYEIKYTCDWWQPIKISRSIDRVEYASTVENIYLFYEQSIYQRALNPGATASADMIYIYNLRPENRMNFFIADQDNSLLNPIYIDRPTDGSVSVFTDVSMYEVNTAVTPISPTLINTYELNRIFDITINICKAEDVQADRYKEVYYTLKSTKER